MEQLHFADLFAGIGGFRLAFEAQGARCVFSSEIDKFACQTYEENFGEKPSGDVTKIDVKDIPNIDILTAGFPCQSFSSIGKREGFASETKGALFFEIVRIARAKKPKAMLLENVKGLLTHDDGKTFDIIKKSLDELNYTIYFKLINSADFSVPQKRERVYIVCFRKDVTDHTKFQFPKNKKRVGIGKFIESNASGYSISKHLQKSYLFKKEDGRPRIVDKQTKDPSNTLVSTYHKIQRLTGTFVKDGETGLRLFTKGECIAQQGFPKTFKVPVSRTQMYRQFGNSVSVPVVKAIAKNIVKCL
jgi:DNA (cytosine-5)-methyltransferase 1